jgi:hypothetical protein
VKNFGLRLKGGLTSGGLWSFASSWIRGFSSARTSIKFLFGMIALLLPVTILVLVSNLRATANVITVNTTSDTPAMGFCTLREAIANANAEMDTSGGDCTAGTGDDLINFSPGLNGTIDISTNGTLPQIMNVLTIDGTGATITVSGASMVQVMVVHGLATLMLNNLTVANGNYNFGGGGIGNSGTLTINNSTLSANNARTGGGISSSPGSTLVITNSTFVNNTADIDNGGGVFADGTLVVTNSTFAGNSAMTKGGGIFSDTGATTSTITNATFSGNTASGGVGDGGPFTITAALRPSPIRFWRAEVRMETAAAPSGSDREGMPATTSLMTLRACLEPPPRRMVRPSAIASRMRT